MKYLKLLVIVLIIALLLIFVIQNVGQEVNLKFFRESSVITTEMILVVLVTLVIGFLIGYLIGGVQILNQKNRFRVLAAEYKKLKKELDLLRNKDLEETEESL